MTNIKAVLHLGFTRTEDVEEVVDASGAHSRAAAGPTLEGALCDHTVVSIQVGV
jgi:hypothetical protein